MRRALAIDEASYGRDPPEAGADLRGLALLLKESGQVAEAASVGGQEGRRGVCYHPRRALNLRARLVGKV
jgi:hypothetical protein